MKKSRHQRIKELVEQFEIETQEELADRLKNDGYPVTQATVSRDIRELKLSKVPIGDGRQKYTILVQSDHYAMKFKEIVGSIAGDDTIMMAVRTVEDTECVMEKIRNMLEE